MNAIQRFFFNIFLFCFGLGLLFFVKLDSYADGQASLSYRVTSGGNYYLNNNSYSVTLNPDFEDVRLAFFIDGNTFYLLSNVSNLTISRLNDVAGYNSSGNLIYSNSTRIDLTSVTQILGSYTFYRYDSGGGALDIVAGPNSFSDIDVVYNYLFNNTLPELPFDDSLELDSFQVTSWSIGNFQALFKSKFDVKWSDPRITLVQVRISGPAYETSYESSSSPFKGKFQADQFVFNKGDVIHLVATPYEADGSYGTSLYYSVTYSDNIPFSNYYRKMVNNNTNDNTLTIPYSGTSGNDTVTLPVDGVATNITYKVNYNPTTNEYGDINIYEINYNPIIVYPSDTPEEVIDETQDTIINEYNTNNYYETTKNININFDIDFGDISTNDIGEGFNSVSGFFNGFGSFIGRISNWILALFPFLPPIVANSIVFMFGLVIFIAGIALILKIIGAVGNIIDAILPL